VEVNTREFRNALGRFATGVTVITCADADRTHGMTVNSFVSVSLNPPLVLVSLDNQSSMHGRFAAAGSSDPGHVHRFGISVLAEHQEALSNHFAGRTIAGMHVPLVMQDEVPLIEGALAHFVVRVTATHIEGDHTLYLCHVEYFAAHAGRPLLFHSGRYRQLNAEKRGDTADEFSLFSMGDVDPSV
jgi:flavin reductase (DIM6/NTAB) family NADH-FMN oxidoreductase RutF